MPRLYNSSSSSNSSSATNNNRYTPYRASQSNTRPTASSSSFASSTPSVNIRYNSSGYRQFNTSTNNSNSGWQFTHRRVAEKSIGREIKPTEHVHHINRIKTDNRRNNLVVLDQSIHQHLHSTRNEKTACFRCGSTSHYASNCYARTDVFGRSVVGSGTRTSYYDSSDDSDDSDDSDSDSGGGGCSRCGRTSHSASSCYARTDVYGNGL